jgi:DNA-directed RNA polymerase specialized sigma24 family protein
MQQTEVLDAGFDRPTRADHQPHHVGGRAPAPAATAELVARASLGEQAAWDQLVERYGAMVWTVARRHGLGLEDGADVSQVTWLLLTQHLGSLSEPDRLGVWLFTTASREALRMRRLRGAEGCVAAGHDRSDPWRQRSASVAVMDDTR